MNSLAIQLLYQIGLGIVTVILVVALTTYIQVRGMSNPKLKPYVAKKGRQDRRIELTLEARQWAQQNGFVFKGYYMFQSTAFIAAWQREDRPMFFCFYVVQHKTLSDLITIFDGDIGLTTGSRSDSHFFPRSEKSYMQSFSRCGFDGFWDRHVAAENYLIDHGADLVEQELDFTACLVEAVGKQMQFVRQIPLWPLRGLWWFAVRKFRWHNLTIQQQREKNMIRLPDELEKVWTAQT